MVIRRRSGAFGLNTPLRIWLLAGFTSFALVLVAVSIYPHIVHANVLLPRPAASVPPSVPADSVATVAPPDSLTPERTVAAQRKALLRGLASWYGEAFDGQTTASGERFDMRKMTACHPSLPFGSLVRVVNLKNGRSVIVRITDRGELAEGRIIDLSKAAAQKLAMTEAGLAPVKLDVISRGKR